MYQIGVVGPNTSVDRILGLADEFGQVMRFIPLPYSEFQETRNIVKENDHQVDMWLFSGKLSYLIAKSVLESDENLVHIQHTESSLYRCFLLMAYHQGKFIERVSIDELADSQLEVALQQLDFPAKDLFVKTYDIETNPDDLLAFHLQLWREGKTEGAITCFEGVYLALKEAGVPAYWFTPSELEVHQALRILSERVRAFYFKDTQIAVEIIEIDDFDKIAENARNPYRLQYLELRLKEALIRLCETIDGSLMERGNGRYVIFSSRGAIERRIDMLRKTIEQLSLESESRVAVGIGFGETVFSAEVNALRAIQHSKEKTEPGIVIVQEDGKVIETAGKDQGLSYSYRMDDPQFLDQLKKANVGIRTYNKIAAFVRRMGWTNFTTKDLATQLHLDERNVRRIITSLSEVGLAAYVGEEATSLRGRPSKIYRLE
ncbi:hypothetical protein EDM59_07305 [Brevibacillus nitrificans]|uniref:Transcriptional regulator n=1 Tax=Brevibacillus nitrificans TaxID=651560 RepID=A0A3M8DLH0_9BACL|nr:hypothetical protein [Brevibacillus nitrificans]RNB88893.1 hypothetical protein EDM59_07305 [Brevibacillus nitrificans]